MSPRREMKRPLTHLAAATKRRNETQRRWEDAIHLAHANGYSLRQIAAIADVSHTAIAKILAR